MEAHASAAAWTRPPKMTIPARRQSTSTVRKAAASIASVNVGTAPQPPVQRPTASQPTTANQPAAPQQRRRRKCRVAVDVSACRYAIVRKCLRERDFRLVKKSNEPAAVAPKWDIWWSDRGDLLRDLPRLSPFQKVNHFPSMEEICRKDFLANNLNAMVRVLPTEYDFFPRSFLLPAESVGLQQSMESGPKNATYIAKPRTLCQGKGITIVQSFSKVPANEPCVVQRYIDNPLLIDGYKFDLRIYVLVYSVNPLTIYIFRNGLARFCTTPFQKPTAKNLAKKRMHLTNYAINKNSKDFQQATSAPTGKQASKRSVAAVLAELEAAGRCSSAAVWDQISSIVVKTLLCVEPKLLASYKSYFGATDATEAQWGPKCFEILGFDIMLDATGKAWLFEVNHAPSFAGDSPLDRDIKSALISATLDIVAVTNDKKRDYLRQQRADWAKRLWSHHQPRTTEAATTAAVETPKIAATPELSDDVEATEESDEEREHASSDSERDEDDATREQQQSGAQEPPASGALKNVLCRRNRVTPATCSSDKREQAFENVFELLYPLDSRGGSEPAEKAHAQPLFDRIREAAQVNRSKLWN